MPYVLRSGDSWRGRDRRGHLLFLLSRTRSHYPRTPSMAFCCHYRKTAPSEEKRGLRRKDSSIPPPVLRKDFPVLPFSDFPSWFLRSHSATSQYPAWSCNRILCPSLSQKIPSHTPSSSDETRISPDEMNDAQYTLPRYYTDSTCHLISSSSDIQYSSASLAPFV